MWKKNSPFLYDLVVTHALEWPSLTCQWFPDVEDVPGKNYKIQRLLLGTHTNDNEPNFLQIASVKIPKGHNNDEKNSNNYEDVTMEDANGDNETFIKITQKIPHDGEVNRARYKVDNPDLIATKSCTGDVYIFDRATYDPFPKENEKFNPTLRLTGHDKEGYGLAWNPHKQKSSHLLSAGFDFKICQWDVAGTVKENNILEPIRIYTAHTSGVEDVAWHTKFDSIFASVGDDARLMIWDTRNDSSKPIHNIRAHEAEVNCVSFASGSEWVLATGSGDKTAALWDLRNLKSSLHTLRAHQSEILQLSWSPHHDSILATASSDRRILVWDLSRIDAPQLPEEAEDGPPELLFMHGGHTNKISDFGWNPVEPWVLASTADDNIVQVWEMANSIYNPRQQVVEEHQDSTLEVNEENFATTDNSKPSVTNNTAEISSSSHPISSPSTTSAGSTSVEHTLTTTSDVNNLNTNAETAANDINANNDVSTTSLASSSPQTNIITQSSSFTQENAVVNEDKMEE
ncbi:WD40-repeat-containing domain protein [Cokeromyces recurvatus]|uniref:WD40-repeat-containing domain protein n=1 Tax=Cokeromyces recurvatus TaxID=90255 RepID=UPI00221F1C89|nr:WD40-repeat-containing domain protein [Cokeromyces recurvatus]KAI7907045.1 WD40-repeat-containing domain protein [Cokeromyces recurvatus]